MDYPSTEKVFGNFGNFLTFAAFLICSLVSGCAALSASRLGNNSTRHRSSCTRFTSLKVALFVGKGIVLKQEKCSA
jgi:hypothetical protein